MSALANYDALRAARPWGLGVDACPGPGRLPTPRCHRGRGGTARHRARARPRRPTRRRSTRPTPRRRRRWRPTRCLPRRSTVWCGRRRWSATRSTSRASFTTARPAGSAAGVNTVPRSNLLAFSISTGQLLPWAPVADGQVRSITRSPDGSRIYITGDFSHIDGVYHVRIAAFSTATNTIVAGFKPTLAAAGLAVAASNTTVYAGGNFVTCREHHGRHAGPAQPPGGVRRRDRCADAVRRRRQRRGDVPGGHRRPAAGRRRRPVHEPERQPVLRPRLGQPDERCAGLVPGQRPDPRRGSAVRHHEPVRRRHGHLRHGLPLRRGRQRRGPVPINATTTGALIWVADCHGDSYSAFPVGRRGLRGQPRALLRQHGRLPADRPLDRLPRHGVHPDRRRAPTRPTSTATRTTSASRRRRCSTSSRPSTPAPSPDRARPRGASRATATTSSTAGSSPGVNGAAQQGLVRFAVPGKAPNKQGPQLSGAELDADGQLARGGPGPHLVPVQLRPRQRDAHLPALPRLREHDAAADRDDHDAVLEAADDALHGHDRARRARSSSTASRRPTRSATWRRARGSR